MLTSLLLKTVLTVLFLNLVNNIPHDDEDHDDPTIIEVNDLCNRSTIQYTASLRPIYEQKILPRSGFLISSHWFMTLATNTLDIQNINHYYVQAGVLKARKISCKHLHIHPMFDVKMGDNNLALIELLGSFQNFKYPLLAGPKFSATCEKRIMVAWEDNRNDEEDLNPRELPTLNCIETYDINIMYCVKEYKSEMDLSKLICSDPGTRGDHPCYRDSGLPLICNNVVIGVLLFSTKCAGLANKNKETTYIKLELYIDFISVVLKTGRYHLEKDESFVNETVYYVARGAAVSKLVVFNGCFGYLMLALNKLRLFLS